MLPFDVIIVYYWCEVASVCLLHPGTKVQCKPMKNNGELASSDGTHTVL